MSDMYLGSQAPLYQNVCIRRRNKDGKILEERFAKNRVTRLMLYGIGKFLLGQFNNSSVDKMYEMIPRYLALGTNTPGLDASTAGVSTFSSVNDTRLLNEITQSSTTGASESVKRVWIAERNMCKLNTKFSDPFIKVSIKTYISSNHYDGMLIGEAGLFSKEKDNNCLARVCFSPIVKNHNEVLDIQWDITLLSYGETQYPEKLSIENGSKIALPLKYTNKHFKEFNIGLKRFPLYNSIGNDTYKELFTYNENGELTTTYTEKDMKDKSGWYEYLASIGLEDYFHIFYQTLKDGILNDSSNDGRNSRFINSKTQNIPTLFYFGNLYANQNLPSQDSNNLCTMLLYSEDKSYSSKDIGARYVETNVEGTYEIVLENGDKKTYKVVNNRFYKKSETNSEAWVETIYFMYNGSIVDINQNETGYTYKNGHFYKTDTIITDTFTHSYLNFSGTTDEKFYVYSIDSNLSLFRDGYTIDLNNNSEIYLNNEDTTYHLSSDLYYVSGEYVKLIPVITPSTATDKSITWKTQNKDIATINWDGIVTAWNLGETTAIAFTTNDLRAKCIIDVVKDTKFIDIDSIKLDPDEVTLYVDEDINQFTIVSANITPLFATNSTVSWSLSYDISNCITLINLGNNTVKLTLNDSGNIGTGYLTATSQSGLSASCLVRVIYKSLNDECDCPDPSHLNQEG